MQNANALMTPLAKDVNFLPAGQHEKFFYEQGHKQYRSLMGCLMYLAVCTHPDISFGDSLLSHQVHAPTARHLSHAKRVLRFVAGTVDVGLLYSRSIPKNARSFHASVDADKGESKEKRGSTSGWIIRRNKV